MQRLALVGPLEGFGHRAIEIFDKGQDFGLQILNGGEAATFEQFASQNAEPDFDLIHPRAVFGRVVEDNAVRRVAEEGCPRRLRLQDAALAFDAQVDGEVRFGRHVADQGLGLMRVQVVRHEVPLLGGRIGFDRPPDVLGEVDLSASRPAGRLIHASGRHIEVDDQRLGTMADVLELPTLDLAGSQRQARVLPFQRLHPGQLVG